jgi:hypothetical protein
MSQDGIAFVDTLVGLCTMETREGLGKLKDHPWYQNFNWASLRMGNMCAPHTAAVVEGDQPAISWSKYMGDPFWFDGF